MAFKEFDELGTDESSFLMNQFGYKGVVALSKRDVAILDAVAKPIPRNKIRTEHPIANIDYTDADIIQRHSNRATVQPETVLDSRIGLIIATSSLGHLKKYSRCLFSPPLPPKLQEAVDIIGQTFQEIVSRLQSDPKIVFLLGRALMA